MDRILSIPQLDAVGSGPSDLSASYGCPGEYDNPVVLQAIQTVRQKASAAGKATGRMHHTAEEMARSYAAGERYLSIGSDQQILMNGLKQLVGAVRAWQTVQK